MSEPHSNTGNLTSRLSNHRVRTSIRGYDLAMGRFSTRETGFFAGLAMLLTVCAGCTSDVHEGEMQESSLTIFAAASLQDLVADLADEMRNTEPLGIAEPLEIAEPLKITVSFAGSNTLAQQILASPGADLFLSADTEWMDHLEAAGRLVDDSRRKILGNRLVLVARRDTSLDIGEPRALARASFRHLALGDPEAVPAGRYARSALMHLEVWDEITDRVLPSPNVRAALALVESDPEILGIVYQTDAAVSDRVKVLTHLDPIPGLDITYHAAVVRGGSNPEAASRFLDLMASPAGQAMALRHGFLPPPSDG